MGGEVQDGPKNDEIAVQASADPNAPLVLLFGWAGCIDRYLSKYSQIYEQAGLSAVRFTADMRKIRSYGTFGEFALEIYETVLEPSTSPLIVCHAFSMNGCSVFAALWELIEARADVGLKARFKGVIFDSCPAHVTAWQGATAISIAAYPPPKHSAVLRTSYKMFLAGCYSMQRGMMWLRSTWDDKVWERNFAFFRMLKFTDPPRNQLYIYSTTDVICSAKSIERFMETQKQLKVRVEKLVFDDTLHCQHLRVHPDEYSRACLDFLDSLA